MNPRCTTCPNPLDTAAILCAADTCTDCERRQLDREIAATSEWDIFVAAIRQAAVGRRVRQNDVRPLIRGRIYHKHIGSFWRRAVTGGLLVEVGREESKDRAGKNTHHTAGVYELRSAA